MSANNDHILRDDHRAKLIAFFKRFISDRTDFLRDHEGLDAGFSVVFFQLFSYEVFFTEIDHTGTLLFDHHMIRESVRQADFFDRDRIVIPEQLQNSISDLQHTQRRIGHTAVFSFLQNISDLEAAHAFFIL